MVGRRMARPTAIGAALREYLEGHGLGSVAVASELGAKWEELVGPGIAAHSAPRGIKGGRLTVTVDSSAWMNQLSLLSTELVRKINAGHKGEAVTELRFRVGRVSGRDTGQKAAGRAERPPRRTPSADEMAEIERAASGIPDPELRARAKKLMVTAASTKR